MEIAALSADEMNRSRSRLMTAFAVAALGYAVIWAAVLSHGSHEHSAATEHAAADVVVPATFSVIPFVILLGCIAVLPALRRTAHWWETNWNRLMVSLGCAAATFLYYWFVFDGSIANHLTHESAAPGLSAAMTVLVNAWLVEYIPFVTLLFSLYVISGGIVISGRFSGRPAVNCGMIGIGTVLASFVGTTGAAMLMIRPLLRANQNRRYIVHTVVFFIFTVCNTGGCLLPIGDPPLFLGFLRGVSFFWTLHLWPMWLMMNVLLLAIYFVVDWYLERRETPRENESTNDTGSPGLQIRGLLNLVWLFGVVAAVATLDPGRPFPGTHWYPPLYYRELIMISLATVSLWLTSTDCRIANSFNYDAILEVAALFLGIFVCMQPAVQILNACGSQLGLDSPFKFFWATGLLSSCLDNAPTYVVFFETARTLPTEGARVANVPETLLIAISLGAVFLGAMTYIGNGPNLMIKAIAECHNVRMPGFFGYLGYSCLILLPVAALVTGIFLS